MQGLPLPSCCGGTCSGLLCSLQNVSSCRNICCDSRTRDVSGGTGDKWHSSHANALPDNAAGELRPIYLVAGWNKSKKAASLHNVHYCVNKNYPGGSLFCHFALCFFKGIGKIDQYLDCFVGLLIVFWCSEQLFLAKWFLRWLLSTERIGRKAKKKKYV